MAASDLHFMIVDDFAPMRRIVGALLKDLGYPRQTEADDGSTAWKILESGASSVDFVLTDWNMPLMDGIALLRKIRSHPDLAHLPVLMVTAETHKDNILHAAQCGADGYIVKPFNADTLERQVRRIVARRAQMLAAA
ncbi:response regulator [Herbaspirillum sp. WKF16]|jgi:two-component system chemotaxis response regulator CheY|uniref:response regulator n=1 Tax=Herbaspirillum sp. WKF16 TaxID=3028312 RepID=UPI0023A9533A|nr:response regulator [Herbaspirillum sp. WKF16]WDZ96657.1 response regulator [Herbaspirillum sp. WKF16]